MREDEVYIRTKAWLTTQGFVVVGGQPPSGCDNLPVIEIKAKSRPKRGSYGAFKPDLIAADCDHFLIVECKPDHSNSDLEKLLEVLNDEKRQEQLFSELTQRRIFERHGLSLGYADFSIFSAKLRGALAHAGHVRVNEKVGTIKFVSAIDSVASGALSPEVIVQFHQPLHAAHTIHLNSKRS